MTAEHARVGERSLKENVNEQFHREQKRGRKGEGACQDRGKKQLPLEDLIKEAFNFNDA